MGEDFKKLKEELKSQNPKYTPADRSRMKAKKRVQSVQVVKYSARRAPRQPILPGLVEQNSMPIVDETTPDINSMMRRSIDYHPVVQSKLVLNKKIEDRSLKVEPRKINNRKNKGKPNLILP